MLKKQCVAIIVFMFFCLSITLLGNESVKIYFPGTLDSYWVYEDENGNELTRTIVEGEEIAGEEYPALEYEPELEEWLNYNQYIHPFLYSINEEGIALLTGEDIENAIEARIENEFNLFFNTMIEQAPAEIGLPDFELDINVEAKGQEKLLLLPESIVPNEEWDVNQIEVNAKMGFLGEGVPDDQILVIDYTIIETGIVLGTETVETAAGTFENCLKVEYRTETAAILTPDPGADEVDPPGETITTVWFAPNVGMVKLHQASGYIFIDMIPDDEIPVVFPQKEDKTFELINYEIKTSESEEGTEE